MSCVHLAITTVHNFNRSCIVTCHSLGLVKTSKHTADCTQHMSHFSQRLLSVEPSHDTYEAFLSLLRPSTALVSATGLTALMVLARDESLEECLDSDARSLDLLTCISWAALLCSDSESASMGLLWSPASSELLPSTCKKRMALVNCEGRILQHDLQLLRTVALPHRQKENSKQQFCRHLKQFCHMRHT